MINTSIGCVTTEYCNRMTVPNPLLDGRTVLDWTFYSAVFNLRADNIRHKGTTWGAVSRL